MEIISAKYVLTMDGEPIEDGAIATEFNKIVEVGKREELIAANPHATHEEHPDKVIMPGLIDAHTHLDVVEHSNLLNMATTNTPDFAQWVVSCLRYQEDAPLDTQMGAVKKALDTLITNGTTCVGDMTCFDGVFQVIEDAGIRAVVFPQIFGGAPSKAQDRFEGALAKLDEHMMSEDEMLKVGLGPYSPYLLSKNLLTIIARHSKEAGVPLQTHCAESFTEMELFYDSKGPLMETLFPAMGWKGEPPPSYHKTPIHFLNDINFLEAGPSIVGGIQLGLKDLSMITRNMCRVVYLPRTNHILGHGSFPFGKLREVGIPIGLGTDTLGGPSGLNLWEELRFVNESVITPMPSPKELLQMATIGGARALNQEHIIGTLTPGKRADFIVVDLSECPTSALVYDSLIRHTRPHNVRKVVVNGNVLKSA